MTKNYNKLRFINDKYKRSSHYWETKLSLDSFFKNPNSVPNKGIYSFNINPTTSQTYSSNIGSSERLENVVKIRIDKFSIPLPKYSTDLISINNSFTNPNIQFKNSDVDFQDENELVETDYNQLTVSLTGSDYLNSYRSLITNGKVYVGIKEFSKQSTSLKNGNYYHFEFDAKFIAHPYPSLELTPSNDFDFLIFTSPINDVSILTFEFFTECERLVFPNDCVSANPIINDTVVPSGELQFILKNNIDDITDFAENLRGSKIEIPDFTFVYEERTGTIVNQNSNFLRNSVVELRSNWGELENYIKNNILYMDHKNNNELIILPTPINLDDVSGSGPLTPIDFIEYSNKKLSVAPGSTTSQWIYNEFNTKSKQVNIKIFAHRIRIPLVLVGLVDLQTE